MSDHIPAEATNRVVDRAAALAEGALSSTKAYANQALDGAFGQIESARQQATPLLNGVSDQAGALLHRGTDAVKEGSQHLRDTAHRANESTVRYISQDPIKAMLIAAATGAALMALIGLMGRSRNHA